jgi:hypothetical protein
LDNSSHKFIGWLHTFFHLFASHLRMAKRYRRYGRNVSELAKNLSENAWGYGGGMIPYPSDLTAAQRALIEPLLPGGENALRLLPARVPHIRAAERGDGFAARPESPKAQRPSTKHGWAISTPAWAAWLA